MSPNKMKKISSVKLKNSADCRNRLSSSYLLLKKIVLKKFVSNTLPEFMIGILQHDTKITTCLYVYLSCTLENIFTAADFTPQFTCIHWENNYIFDK